MDAVMKAADELEQALATVDEARLYQLGDRLDPPAVVLGMPSLHRESFCDEFTSARFSVFVMVAFDDRARNRLWQLVEPVADAIDSVADAVVTQAIPVPFNANGTELPAYEISVEVAL